MKNFLRYGRVILCKIVIFLVEGMKVRENEAKNEVFKDREAELQVGEYRLNIGAALMNEISLTNKTK